MTFLGTFFPILRPFRCWTIEVSHNLMRPFRTVIRSCTIEEAHVPGVPSSNVNFSGFLSLAANAMQRCRAHLHPYVVQLISFSSTGQSPPTRLAYAVETESWRHLEDSANVSACHFQPQSNITLQTCACCIKWH